MVERGMLEWSLWVGSAGANADSNGFVYACSSVLLVSTADHAWVQRPRASKRTLAKGNRPDFLGARFP